MSHERQGNGRKAFGKCMRNANNLNPFLSKEYKRISFVIFRLHDEGVR